MAWGNLLNCTYSSSCTTVYLLPGIPTGQEPEILTTGRGGFIAPEDICETTTGVGLA